MLNLKQNKTALLRFLVGSLNDYVLRYQKLKQELRSDNAYLLFAEPFVSGQNIIWRTPETGEPINFASLSETQQNQIKIKLRASAINAKSVMPEDSRILPHIENYFTVPSDEDIFIIKKDKGEEQIVLTNWGTMSDAADNPPSKIMIGEDFPVPVVFKTMFSDTELAPNHQITIAYNQIHKENKTDENALLDFGKVNIGVSFEAYQIVNNQPANTHHFICDGREFYEIKVLGKRQISVKFEYDTGEDIPDYDFTFEFNGNRHKLTSNKEAEIILPELIVGTKIDAYKEKGEQKFHKHEFVSKENQTDNRHKIIIPKPKIKKPPIVEQNELKIQLVDKKDIPLSNIKIDLFKENNLREEMTDKEGYAHFKHLKEGELNQIPYTVHYGKHKIPLSWRYKTRVYELYDDKVSKTGSKLKYRSNINEYKIKIKPRCLWCLLLLLLPLLLLIRINDSVEYIVKQEWDKQPVQHIQVDLNYTPDNKPVTKENTSNADGIVKYSVRGKRIWQILLGEKTADHKLTATAKSKTGKAHDSRTDKFYEIKDKLPVLWIKSSYRALEIEVVSKENTDFKIAGAEVNLKAKISGKDTVLNAVSDSSGICVFQILSTAKELKLTGSKAGYYNDSTRSNLSSFIADENLRTLKLKPYSYALDIVICTDATGSMDSLLLEIKSKAETFYSDLKDAMLTNDKYTEKMRVRVVVYRDYYSDKVPMFESDFFNMPDQTSDYKKALKKAFAKGGGDAPESGLEALALSINSDWNTTGDHIRQIIVLWTDADAHDLNHPKRKSTSKIPKSVPADFAALSEKWESLSETARIVLFAPRVGQWKKIANEWKNVMLTANSGKITDDDYTKAIEAIAKNI